MERQVHQDRALFDKPEVQIDFFELPFDLLDKVIAPNLVVLQVNVCDQSFIQVNPQVQIFIRVPLLKVIFVLCMLDRLPSVE